MIWEGNIVSLSNYEKVFCGYPKDTLEVIRSALFDCTPIEDYIKRFSNDSYMLWQVKLCLDEGVDESWFDICPNGSTLGRVRELVARGINVNPLAETLEGSNLSGDYFDYIIKWYEKGIYLGNYNFSILPADLLAVFDYGLSLGYPMHLFNNGKHFKYEYVLACLRLLSNGKSIDRFLEGNWDLANISLLSRYSKTKYYDKLIDYVSSEITPSVLEEIYECCKVGMPLKEVSMVDKDGIYVFSGVHIALAREAFLKKMEYRGILKPGISISDATAVLNEMELKSSKRLSGRLHKN